MQKIPYMLVVGDREAAEGTVGVRHRAGGDQGAQRTAQFIAAALRKCAAGSRQPQRRRLSGPER